MRNPLDGKGGADSLVDTLIGNAYEVVAYVAYYVKEIRYVAFNMEHVFRVSKNMYEHQLKEIEITALDTVYEIDLPTGLTVDMILNSSVNVITTDSKVYGPSADTFTWLITGGKLTVTVPPGAPGTFVGGTLRWLINWQSPVVVS